MKVVGMSDTATLSYSDLPSDQKANLDPALLRYSDLCQKNLKRQQFIDRHSQPKTLRRRLLILIFMLMNPRYWSQTIRQGNTGNRIFKLLDIPQKRSCTDIAWASFLPDENARQTLLTIVPVNANGGAKLGGDSTSNLRN